MSLPIKKDARQILSENLSRTSPLADSFTLFAHNIRSRHNVGALFRSCDSFGVRHLVLSGYTPCPPDPAISKTALGAEQVVAWRRTASPLEEIRNLRRSGALVCGLEQTDRSIPLHEFRPGTPNICLLLGNEVTGIDETLLPLVDTFVEIPQFGSKHSLNVSVAAGIALYALFEKSL